MIRGSYNSSKIRDFLDGVAYKLDPLTEIERVKIAETRRLDEALTSRFGYLFRLATVIGTVGATFRLEHDWVY
jgi:hypothetical protein